MLADKTFITNKRRIIPPVSKAVRERIPIRYSLIRIFIVKNNPLLTHIYLNKRETLYVLTLKQGFHFKKVTK